MMKEAQQSINGNYQIVSFREEHQPDVDGLMDSIAAEYSENIYSSQFRKLNEIARLPNHRYWAASVDGKVVGTIGLCVLENSNVELKRLFLRKEFRGKGVSKALLDTALKAAVDDGLRHMYLGTMNQFKAAHAFYEKNGFTALPQASLPRDFLVNPVDKKFYGRVLR